MGCCVCVTIEVKSSELQKEADPSEIILEVNQFNDLNLSSDEEMPQLKDWIDYKSSKSISESTAAFTSINLSCKKPGTHLRSFSNQGSITDSFSVASTILHK